MFTPKQDVQWWAERLKMIKLMIRCSKNKYSYGYREIAKSNYAQMLTAAFTVLFNERQKKGSYLDGLR